MKSKHAQHLVPRVVVTALFASVCLSPPSARLCAAYESPKASAILGRYTEVFPRPWRYQVCDRYIPDWAMEELSADSDRPPERIESKAAALKRCRDDTSNPRIISQSITFNSIALAFACALAGVVACQRRRRRRPSRELQLPT